MLSAFPQLFSYSPLAIAGLRILFSIWFLTYGYSTLFKRDSQDKKVIPWSESVISSLTLLVGLFTFIGLFTQVAILVGLFILLFKWYADVKSNTLTREIFEFGFYIAVIGIALLFLGAGAWAIDLPL